MSEKGAALQTYNQELVKGIEALKKMRTELMGVIAKEEEKKKGLEIEMNRLSERLESINKSLEVKQATKDSYDDAIETAEAAYMKACICFYTESTNKGAVQFSLNVATTIGIDRNLLFEQCQSICNVVTFNLKILESSQALLSVIRQDAISLDQSMANSSSSLTKSS